MSAGTVIALFTAPAKGAPMERRAEARAVPERGLEGDRYYKGEGAFSRWPGPHRDVSLIAEEDLAAMADATGIACPPEETRRNILTRGVPLADLIGTEFTVGGVRMRGMRRCQPCAYLERITGRDGLLKAMVDRGGLRARILSEGVLHPGDAVRT